MSRDFGRDVLDLEKLYARKLWADFRTLSFVNVIIYVASGNINFSGWISGGRTPGKELFVLDPKKFMLGLLY